MAARSSRDLQPCLCTWQSRTKRKFESAGTYDNLALDPIEMPLLCIVILLLYLASVLSVTPMCDLVNTRGEDIDREVKPSVSIGEI